MDEESCVDLVITVINFVMQYIVIDTNGWLLININKISFVRSFFHRARF